MYVTSLYTNIPQEEGITTVCAAYDAYYDNNPPIRTCYLRERLRLILKENSFHGTAMGAKMAVAFANIFMTKIETDILSKSVCHIKKPTIWKRSVLTIYFPCGK